MLVSPEETGRVLAAIVETNWGFPQMGDPQKRLVSNGNRKSYLNLNGRFRGTPIPGNVHISDYMIYLLVVSTPLKNMKVNWDDDILNIWKVIKFHGSKPPIGNTIINPIINHH